MTDHSLGVVCQLIMVREAGVEPARPCEHWHLKPASLPIPPLAHGALVQRKKDVTTSNSRCQHFSQIFLFYFFTCHTYEKMGFLSLRILTVVGRLWYTKRAAGSCKRARRPANPDKSIYNTHPAQKARKSRQINLQYAPGAEGRGLPEGIPQRYVFLFFERWNQP